MGQVAGRRERGRGLLQGVDYANGNHEEASLRDNIRHSFLLFLFSKYEKS